MMKEFAASPLHRSLMITAIARLIKREIKSVRGTQSLSCKDLDRMKQLSWEAFLCDLQRHLPILFLLLSQLLKSSINRPDKCIIAAMASMLMKNHSKRLCFLQGVFSVMFFAKGCPKLVCKYYIDIYACIMYSHACHESTYSVSVQ
jgi:hypothetical protein